MEGVLRARARARARAPPGEGGGGGGGEGRETDRSLTSGTPGGNSLLAAAA